MGNFKFKKRKHTLRVIYEVAVFEEMIETGRKDVEELVWDRRNIWTQTFDNHDLLVNKLKQGVNEQTFWQYIQQIITIFASLSRDYVNCDEIVQCIEQFIVDDNTNKVKLIYVKSIGMSDYLSCYHTMRQLISHTLFLYSDTLEKELVRCMEILNLQDWEHYFMAKKTADKYYLLDTYTQQQHTISKKQTVIGSMQADILLTSPTVSRQHALIFLDNQKLFIQDTHSLNGTYLNEQLLNTHQRYPLHHLDKITIATHTFEVHDIEQENPYAANNPLPTRQFTDWRESF